MYIILSSNEKHVAIEDKRQFECLILYIAETNIELEIFRSICIEGISTCLSVIVILLINLFWCCEREL